MRRYYYLLCLPLLLSAMSCGTGTNTPTNSGLFGSWNIAMSPTNGGSPVYVFALAMSQEGSSSYSGASTTYTGTVAIPSNMCINGNLLQARATTENSTFTMTITDPSSSTTITVTGTLAAQNATITGTYTTAGSLTCSASQGSVSMVAQ
jgi:hypothetical protein